MHMEAYFGAPESYDEIRLKGAVLPWRKRIIIPPMNKPSRRDFVASTAGATAATFWIPKQVHGYSRAHVTDLKGSRGVSKWDLDTPALVLDLDKLDQNIGGMRAFLASTKVAARPHAKTHKSAEISKLQLAAGAVGICTAKLSEAETLFAEGVQKMCMTTANLSPAKIRRAMELRKKNRDFIQAVDHMQNARDLSDAAKAAGVTADVVVDVAVGTRSGVPPGDLALALAQAVDKMPNLKFRGMLAYDGGAQHIKGYKARHDQSLARYEDAMNTFDRMKKSGLEHGDLQRRRHGDLQHHDEGARVHGRAGRQLRVHGRAVPGDREREGRNLH